MYELTVALKYLVPRWRQLSVSIISLISIVVIALVVWLIVVFFSVTHGLEKSWTEKMIAVAAPVRITPTEKYTHSFYYLSDTISATSHYSLKSIGEKLESDDAFSYDPSSDEEVPTHWPQPDLHPNGEPKDLVKEVYFAAKEIPGVHISDYEVTVANLRIHFNRDQTELQAMTYLGSFEPANQQLNHTLEPVDADDINNVLYQISLLSENKREDAFQRFFQHVNVSELKAAAYIWNIPKDLFPANGEFSVTADFRDTVPVRLKLADHKTGSDTLVITNGQWELLVNQGSESIPLSETIPIYLTSDKELPAEIVADWKKVPVFAIKLSVQNQQLAGIVSIKDLDISRWTANSSPFWMEQAQTTPLTEIPSLNAFADGILLPKSYKKSGIRIGDTGTIGYQAPTISSVQEQRAPIYIAGFYDPGVMAMGGKYVITNKSLANLVRTSYPQDDVSLQSNGLYVRFEDPSHAENVKKQLIASLKRRGVSDYWTVESYHEYEYTRDLVQQLKSEKNLFSILATIMIVVACSNIISMLVILVNNKLTEIGILRAMGASSTSIAMIFGFCGIVMGFIGSIIGILSAKLTLHYLGEIIGFLSMLQGFEMFSPVFYGDMLPNQISNEALLFVLAATSIVSLISGLVPALKACTARPATILRSE